MTDPSKGILDDEMMELRRSPIYWEEIIEIIKGEIPQATTDEARYLRFQMEEAHCHLKITQELEASRRRIAELEAQVAALHQTILGPNRSVMELIALLKSFDLDPVKWAEEDRTFKVFYSDDSQFPVHENEQSMHILYEARGYLQAVTDQTGASWAEQIKQIVGDKGD